MNRFYFMLASLCFAATSCADSDSSTGIHDNIKPGTETAQPPSKPPTAPQGTGETCSSGNDCANWYCACDDGAVVNSAFCYNGACQTPANHCPAACAAFRHGGWTGRAGGGPVPPSSCSVTQLTLGNNTCVTCIKDRCCSALQACDQDPACISWDRCDAACTDDACHQDCRDQFPDGVARYQGIVDCAGGTCQSTCQ